jgi:hypothetical protein
MLQEQRKEHIWKSHLNDPDFLCECLHAFNLLTCNVKQLLSSEHKCVRTESHCELATQYQHKASPPAALTYVHYNTNKISPNTKQKVWLKERESIKLESDCHLIAIWNREMCQ